jgi:hypothetical protein
MQFRDAGKDRAAWASRIADDVAWIDDRLVIGGTYRGRAEVEAAHQLTHTIDVSAEPIAVRGEHLCLHQVAIANEGVDAQIEYLKIGRWNGAGQTDLQHTFPVDDLAAALAELDRLYLEEVDDLITRNEVRIWTSAYRALNDRDADGMLAFLDAAYIQEDHRQLGWGVQNLAEMTERTRTLTGISGDALAFIARFHGRRGLVDWVEVNLRVTGPDGAVQVDVQHMVNILSAESGLLLRTDRYGDDQTDDARVKFDELSQDAVSSQGWWNVAGEVGARANTWARREDGERFSASFAADLIIEDAAGEPLIGDPAELHGLAVARQTGFGIAHRRVMAVRGERLVLCELRDDEGEERFHRFVVEEVDDDCRIVHITHF